MQVGGGFNEAVPPVVFDGPGLHGSSPLDSAAGATPHFVADPSVEPRRVITARTNEPVPKFPETAHDGHLVRSSRIARSFPNRALSKFLAQHPRAVPVLQAALESVEGRLNRLSSPYAILSQLQFDVDEEEGETERQRFVLEVKVPRVALAERMALWDELSLIVRGAKSEALTKVPMPRAEPFLVGRNLIVHMDLT